MLGDSKIERYDILDLGLAIINSLLSERQDGRLIYFIVIGGSMHKERFHSNFFGKHNLLVEVTL
jgi:hypothetical protein